MTRPSLSSYVRVAPFAGGSTTMTLVHESLGRRPDDGRDSVIHTFGSCRPAVIRLGGAKIYPNATGSPLDDKPRRWRWRREGGPIRSFADWRDGHEKAGAPNDRRCRQSDKAAKEGSAQHGRLRYRQCGVMVA